jgi:hypothetical protein
VDETAQGAGQGRGALVPEAKRSGSLALPLCRAGGCARRAQSR